MPAAETTSSTQPWTIRPLTLADVEGVLHIQAQTYGASFQEERAVFARRLAAQHQCALGVERPGEPGLLAYAVAYWSAPGHITPLNGDFAVPVEGASALYLHDIAVLPALAGQKVAHALVMRLMEGARSQGMTSMGLVAVQGSARFWQRYGFAEQKITDPVQQQHLASYGAGALSMARRL